MALSCPKCGHARAPGATAPDAECPACGVIYAKVTPVPEARPFIHAGRPPRKGARVGVWVASAVIAMVALFAHRNAQRHHEVAQQAAFDGDIDADASAIPPDALRAFAGRVKANEVVLYGTAECVYCGQAKGWLRENGFAFTECDIGADRHCLDEFQAYRAQGTPFIVVRGQLMRDGFDVHQFLRILKETDGKA